MKSIQGILIVGFFLAVTLSGIVFRARLAWRLLAIALFVTATVFVMSPDLTTVIAKALGVGRGADLLLYISLVAGVYAILLLYRRSRQLERKITEHVRASAVRDAQLAERLGGETGACL